VEEGPKVDPLTGRIYVRLLEAPYSYVRSLAVSAEREMLLSTDKKSFLRN